MAQTVTYTIKIGWGGNRNSSILQFDYATFDSPGASFGYEFQPGYEGLYDDVTNRSIKAAVTRGRDDDMSNMVSGKLELDLYDPDGRFNPENPASPIYGQIRPLRPCYVEMQAGGTAYAQFYGWLDEMSSDYDYGASTAHFLFRDMFIWLERFKPTISATGPTTIGAAIGKVLDAVGWIDPNKRSLPAGPAIPNFSAAGTETAMQLIDALLEVDRGVFYVARTGVATYRPRNYKETTTASAFTVTTPARVVPGVHLAQIRNKASVQRQGGIVQVWADPNSILEFQTSEFEPIQTPYLFTDADAYDLAQYLVLKRGNPSNPAWTFDVMAATTADGQVVLSADIFSRFTVSVPGIPSQDYFIEKITSTGEAGKIHTANWVLSKPLPFTALIFDTTTFDNGQMIF